MGQIEWSMWANENGLITGIVLVIGGIVALAGQFNLWILGAYGIGIGLITLLLEYPRGKRKSGSSVERRFQKIFTSILRVGRLLTRNYFIRFVFYIAASVPCCFVLQMLLGGVCLQVTSLIYLLAAIKGEEWTPIMASKGGEPQGPKVIEQPKRPPPRRPNPPPTRPPPPGAGIEAGEAENRV